MSIEIGSIVEGTVTNVTSFGAFIKPVNIEEDGLVHISEIANEYVSNIVDHVNVGDKVKIKIIGRNKNNKLELSMKQALEKEPPKPLFIKTTTNNDSFESQLSMFLKKSAEKHVDIRRNLKKKQGISKKRARGI